MRTEYIPEIPGTFLLHPDLHADERGLFAFTGDSTMLPQAGSWRWCFTRSAAGVVRGLHIRPGKGEAKLVRCSRGVIFDVITDLRPGSPAYRTLASFRLDGDSQVSLYVPAGCAHGYQAVTGPADVMYHIGGSYDPAAEIAIAWDDPELAIPWPLPATALSGRDKNAMSLAEAEEKGLLPGG